MPVTRLGNNKFLPAIGNFLPGNAKSALGNDNSDPGNAKSALGNGVSWPGKSIPAPGKRISRLEKGLAEFQIAVLECGNGPRKGEKWESFLLTNRYTEA